LEGRLLTSLGKIAGLAGIGVGVFLLLFQSVLKQKFLPQAGLTTDQAFHVIMALMILTFGIAAIGVAAWIMGQKGGAERPVSPLASIVLVLLTGAVLFAAVSVGAGPGTATSQHADSGDSGGGAPLPVTIKCVESGSFKPAPHTILTIKTADGKYIRQEVPPDPNNGMAQIRLEPGRYLLSAIGASGDLPFEVAPPDTTITVQVSSSGDLTPPTVDVPLLGSRYFSGGRVKVSVLALNQSADSRGGTVTFSVTVEGETQRYDEKDIGFEAHVGNFSIYLDSMEPNDRGGASFLITERPAGSTANSAGQGPVNASVDRDALTRSADTAYDRKDYTSALRDYQTLAQANDAWGQLRLGFMYHMGYGTPQDYAQAAVWYRKSADQGRGMAMRDLGILYEHGNGVKQDYRQAAYWYRKAADAGDGGGMNDLGILYEDGYGVPKDVEQAVAWYQKAAAAGDDSAKTNLARLGRLELSATERDQLTKSADAAYDRKDYTSAFNDYTKLAKSNDAWGALRLGFLYQNGWGTRQDYNQAAYWYRKSADAGRAVAMRNLGILYEGGMGVPRDFTQAAQWYRKAADAGDAGGMNNLGILYENGTGVPKDINQAINWYTKASAGGDENGKTNLKRLGR
jgi:TPR repeat protein